MVTMEDLARRLFEKHQNSVIRWAGVPGEIKSWEQLLEIEQEAWLDVAFEAVKVGTEIQQAAVREAYGLNTRET